MLRGARIETEWIAVPSAAAVRDRDRDRLISALLEPVEPVEEDSEVIARLLAERSPEEIAAALVRAHRARLPEPEEMLDQGPRAPARAERPRPGFEDTIWYRMDVGRRHRADPRWLLPLLCRRGHITRNEIGAIRIGAEETMFEIARAASGRFAAALKRTAGDDGDGEGSINFAPAPGPPQDEPRRGRGAGPPPHQAHRAKPFRPKTKKRG